MQAVPKAGLRPQSVRRAVVSRMACLAPVAKVWMFLSDPTAASLALPIAPGKRSSYRAPAIAAPSAAA